jgi:5-methylcytosine-specific restriction enzyme A
MSSTNAKFNEFANAFPSFTNLPFSHNETTRIITDEIPDLLYKELGLEFGNYKIYGSVGTGNWAEIAWLGILDRRITESTTKGYYVVFLYDRELENLFLCLSLGWTQFEEEFGAKEGRQKIRQYRNHYSKLLGAHEGFTSSDIELHAKNQLGKGYEAGTLLSKKYSVQNIDSVDIIDDTLKILDIYDTLKDIVGDNILNLEVTDTHLETVVDDFKKEVAANTFKRIDDDVIASMLGKASGKPPEIRQKMINQIVRNRKFANYIKQKNNFVCELCKRQPFIQKNGLPYAEADHIIPIGGSARGLDDPSNLRCLCAQCHAIITHGSDEEVRKLLS